MYFTGFGAKLFGSWSKPELFFLWLADASWQVRMEQVLPVVSNCGPEGAQYHKFIENPQEHTFFDIFRLGTQIGNLLVRSLVCSFAFT